MIAGFTTWPEPFIDRYIAAGLWSNDTLATITHRWATRHGDAIALVHRGRSRTFTDLHNEVEAVAAGLHQAGITAQDRVVLQLPNSPEFVIAALAMFRIGALPVFSLVSHRDHEIDHLVYLSGAKGYICPVRHRGYDHAALADRVLARSESLQHIFLVDDRSSDQQHLLPAGDATALRAPSARPEEPAFFLLSGGTTALPKLIARTHRDYIYQLRAAGEVAHLTRGDTYLATLPVEFNFAWGCPGVLGSLDWGGCVVIADNPTPDECFELITAHNVTITSLVPTIAVLWLEAREWDNRPLPSLRLIQIGGARLDPGLAQRIRPSFGATLMQVFGMAEGLLSMTRLEDPEDTVLTTQGSPISSHDEIRVVDPDGRDQPPGEPGELLVRGPYTLRGYFNASEHNARAFTPDGFLRTGDVAMITPEGRLVICGRVKDVIIRGGEKINAPEVEEHLATHPGVTAAASVPVPDEFLGEKHYAFVTGHNPPPSPKEAKAWLIAQGLAEYKLPDRVEIVHALPLTPLGKVDKKVLVAAAADPSAPRPWNIPTRPEKEIANV